MRQDAAGDVMLTQTNHVVRENLPVPGQRELVPWMKLVPVFRPASFQSALLSREGVDVSEAALHEFCHDEAVTAGERSAASCSRKSGNFIDSKLEL